MCATAASCARVRQDGSGVELGAGGRSVVPRGARGARAARQRAPGDRLRSRAARPDGRGARQQRRPRAQGLAARPRRARGRARRRSGGGPALALRRSHARRRRRPADRASATRIAAFDPPRRPTSSARCDAFFPEAELIASDHHDWVADPFSLGTWATATVGRAELLTPSASRPTAASRSRPPTSRRRRRAGSRERSSRAPPRARVGRRRALDAAHACD